MDRKKPMPGQIYRHFKNNLYQIVSVAEHTETKEQLVIYQALYEDFRVYARPLEMFLSVVDKEKYPQADQEYRFELVKDFGICARTENEEIVKKEADADTLEENNEEESKEEMEIPQEGAINPLLLEFLDTDTYADKLEVLVNIKNQLDDRLIDDIATAIDVVIDSGSIQNRYESLKSCIETMMKFECGRLR